MEAFLLFHFLHISRRARDFWSNVLGTSERVPKQVISESEEDQLFGGLEEL